MFENNKVYIDYNDNLFNFHKVDEEEKIIEVDLDNCEIKITTMMSKMKSILRQI